MQHPFSWIDQRLDDLREQRLYRTLQVRQSSQAAAIQLRGEQLLNFGSNDYLGLADDPRIRSAVAKALETYGWGAGASPLVTGHSQLHAELEARLAAFESAAAAVLYPTGFAANAGTIAALAGSDTVIFSDARNHASIIDGCRLAGAPIHVYPHNNIEVLGELLNRHGSADRLLIVTDGLFSMDGDLADLSALVELAEDHNAMLLVDEAHATGVLGESGRGACEHFHVHSSAVVRTGTLSKALGSLGGFVVASQPVIDWLVNRSRPLIFSTAAPAAMCAAGLAALEIVQNEPQRRKHLLSRAASLRASLVERGWRIGNSASQIIPVIIGDAETTMRMSAELRSRGVYVPGIRPPSVPAGESLLRISLSYDHDDAMLEQLLTALDGVRSTSFRRN